MILALVLAFASVASSNPSDPPTDSVATNPVSLVPLRATAAPTLAIPEPNHAPIDTTPRKWDRAVSAPVQHEKSSGLVAQTLVSTALLAGGALLTYAGVAYWQNRHAADEVAELAGVDRIGLMVVASVSIPVGAVLAIAGGTSLIASLGTLWSSEGDPEAE